MWPTAAFKSYAHHAALLRLAFLLLQSSCQCSNSQHIRPAIAWLPANTFTTYSAVPNAWWLQTHYLANPDWCSRADVKAVAELPTRTSPKCSAVLHDHRVKPGRQGKLYTFMAGLGSGGSSLTQYKRLMLAILYYAGCLLVPPCHEITHIWKPMWIVSSIN